MLCLKCSLEISKNLNKCPNCGGELQKNRRTINNRRLANDSSISREKRESERRRLFIKRYEEVFLKGPAKGN
jgi:hypothetical protein